jgi:DNA-binding CsgD family transcriptional regulator
MGRTTAVLVQHMTHTASLLAGLHTAIEVEQAAADLIASLIDVDEVLLTRLDLAGDGTTVCGGVDLHVDRRSARYQLSLVTRLDAGCSTGWVLTRSEPEFSAHDVETARLALPFLTALLELADAMPGPGAPSCGGLTPREHAVLEQLATGSPARRIARDLGMTEATARKHLTHIYAKLGVHDRLSAVMCLHA